MSAGFATELLRGSLLVWIRGSDDLRVATDGVSVQKKFVICRKSWKSGMFGLVLNNTTGCC